MRTIADDEVIEAMTTYGGGFARALGEAASRADPENLARLKAAFPLLWTKYGQLAQQDKLRRG
jgi:hypothetical protein